MLSRKSGVLRAVALTPGPNATPWSKLELFQLEEEALGHGQRQKRW